MSKLVFDERALIKQRRKASKWVLEVPKELLVGDRCALSLPGKLLSRLELEITNSTVKELLRRLHSIDSAIRWTAREVVSAFIKRACIADQATNCLTEPNFEYALRRADELDKYFLEHLKPAGPFAGLPVSVKDCFNIKGLDSTLGFVAWIDQPATYDSLLIKILNDAGAIIFCKTNIPTAMMIPETLNNVYGRTTNPHDTRFTPGGSSGGEGALIAMRGSPLGVGTDIGGSVRIPAALCGLYGLKPSFGRFPTYGSKSAMAGQEAVNSINGPMANDLDSLSIFAKAVIDSEPWRWDPKCIPIPWREVNADSVPKKGLVFGIILDDGCVHPTPPVKRALRLTKERLENAGHTVIEWQVKDDEFKRGSEILQTFFTMDGRKGIYEIMKAGGEHERWIPGLGPMIESKTVHDNWSAQATRWSWAAGICERWEAMKGPDGRVMDAIISPANPFAGAEHDHFGKHVGYTGVWNLMDFPGVTLPITTTSKDLDQKENHLPASYYDKNDKQIWDDYDAERSHGIPAGLQLIGRRLEEEKLLAVASVLDDLIQPSNREQ